MTLKGTRLCTAVLLCCVEVVSTLGHMSKHVHIMKDIADKLLDCKLITF